MLPVFYSPGTIVLDCGASQTAMAAFRRRRDRVCLERLAVENIGEETAPIADWVKRTCAALGSLGQKPRPGGSAVLVLPEHLTWTKLLRTPRLAPDRLAQVIRFEAEQNIPFALAEVAWSSLVAGESGEECEVVLTAAKLEVVEPLCAAAQTAGFAPRLVVPGWQATLAGFRLARPAEPAGALVLRVGTRSATLLLVNPAGLAVRTFACEGGDVAAEVARSLSHFRAKGQDVSPARLYLNDRAWRQEALCAELAARLKMPLELSPGAGEIAWASETVRQAGAAQPDLLPDLAGAATLLSRSASSGLNLLPPARLRQAEGHRRRRWLAVATALTLTALLPPTVHHQRVASEALKKVAVLDHRLAPVRATEARCRAGLQRLAAMRGQIARLEALTARRRGWIILLAGLQDRLAQVEDVWLEKLRVLPASTGGPTKLAISGCLLDRTSPLKTASPEAFARVRALLDGLTSLPPVMAVEDERFDNSSPGLLRFDCVLVTAAQPPL